ncbi:MAG TPA: permease [Pedococcus sp.]|nr:permease [Pedococcus sp.]
MSGNGGILATIVEPVVMAARMGWQILWPLILGFTLSGVVQAVVRREVVRRYLEGDSPRNLAWATGLGAASSSCSYAAVALARSLFVKGASLASAMAFEIASTNLVLELGIILALFMGWQFTLAEFVGGPLMIVLVAVGFRLWLRGRIVERAREEAERGRAGAMEGHAGMDMSVQGEGSWWRRLTSRDGLTAVSHYFVMDWASVIRDIVLGLLVAGVVAAWVPVSWLQAFFLTDNPLLASLWGPIAGPLVAVVSFVCSVGNVPLAAVLWNGGISFGGVVSFIFADLIIIPILIIYRRYYGTAAALRITGVFYLAMVLTGYAVELLFQALGLVPDQRSATVTEAAFSWNYTTWLNLVFLALAAVLMTRFVRTGGVPMLSQMNGSGGGDEDQAHQHH